MIAATVHHCTSQPNIRIQNRQARNRKREKDPAVKARIAKWVVGKYCSCGCQRPANCAHHPKGELYETDEAYLNLDECEPYFNFCHHNLHKGLIRCPTCTGWMTPGREKCAKCEGWRSRNIRRGKIKNPCKFNVGRQKCIVKGVCPHSWKNAEKDCRTFERRKPVPVGCGQAQAKGVRTA